MWEALQFRSNKMGILVGNESGIYIYIPYRVKTLDFTRAHFLVSSFMLG